MKLLNKLNKKYIIWSLLVMAFSGAAIYFTLLVIINRQMDERLAETLQTFEKQLVQSPEINFSEPDFKVERIEKALEYITFSDTLIFNEFEQEFEEFRQISAVKNINGNFYYISLRKSKIESEDFLATLALVTLLGMFMLWMILLLVNRRVAKSVWKPFFSNLNIIEQFSVNKQQTVQLSKTGISEFDQLNNVVTAFTRQIINDFQNQKQFSEDVSHELQTPLATITLRIESLLNDPELSNLHTEMLKNIYSSVQRLSKLNKALILLSKIENNQFSTGEKSNLKIIVTEKLKEFSELIRLKKIELKTTLENDFIVPIPTALAEILINNLLSNSINHNVKGGEIKIEMHPNRLIICNHGTEKIAEPEKLFNRFYKVDSSSNSVGLGLAIVKKICDLNGLTIQYHFEKMAHCFTVQN